MNTPLHNPYLGFGVGLRSDHYDHFLEQKPASVDWLEIISENFIQAHEGYWEMLGDLRAKYPFVMHGVSMSIGATDPLDTDYLAKLKKLADFLQVEWVSDHLCYTGTHGENTHDLLPIPYTQEALAHIIPRVHQVQEALGRIITLENASTYLEFDGDTMSEADFIAELHKATGCGVLLDVNNVYVSSTNHGWDARTYIDAIPSEAIVQYHLAGHTDKGTHLLDTHNAPVVEAVWELYRHTLKTHGARSTLIEWDVDVPPFATLQKELNTARSVMQDTLNGSTPRVAQL